MKYVLCFVCLALFMMGCDSSSIEDPGKTHFIRFYGTGGDQTGQDFVVLPDGSMILFGTTRPTQPTKGTQWYLVKVDPQGAVIWEKEFGGVNNEEARDIELTSGGQIVLVGNYYRGANRDVKIMTLTLNGDSINSALFAVRDDFGNPSNGDEDVTSVSETSDGFLIAGSTTYVYTVGKPAGTGIDLRDALKIRVFTDLTEYPNSWTQSIGYVADDVSQKIIQVSPTEFYFFGYTDNLPVGQSITNYNFWVYRLGANGDPDTSPIYPGTVSGNERLTSFCLTPSGYFLGGLSQGGTTSDLFITDVLIPEPGPLGFVQGDIFYEKTLSINLGSSLPAKTSVFPSNQGGFLVLGDENGFDNNQNWLLSKVNDDGSPAWDYHIVFGGEGLDNCGAVQELPDGRLVIVGTMRTGRPDAGEFKLTLMKVSAAGKLEN